MSYKGIRFTLHLLGRVIFSLSIEWIERNLWGGQELATPRPTGILLWPNILNASDFYNGVLG